MSSGARSRPPPNVDPEDFGPQLTQLRILSGLSDRAEVYRTPDSAPFPVRLYRVTQGGAMSPKIPTRAKAGLLLILAFDLWWRGHTIGPTIRDHLGLRPLPRRQTGEAEPLDCDEAAYAYIGRGLTRWLGPVSRPLREQAAPRLLALWPGRGDRGGR